MITTAWAVTPAVAPSAPEPAVGLSRVGVQSQEPGDREDEGGGEDREEHVAGVSDHRPLRV
ncbi:MAG: hypothetical protein M3P39_08240 [Actinomycetota bacterium]|nr:hypothetical protein [Actinomycetota bacterium]